jgi:hypothetical protein
MIEFILVKGFIAPLLPMGKLLAEQEPMGSI